MATQALRFGRKPALLATLFSCAVIAGCGKDSSTPAPAPAAQQFPGYTQVSQTGDAAQLWFNGNDIKRANGGYLVHTLKTFAGGYARFDSLTNCRDTTRRLVGTQYRDDGTALKEYPGNETSVAAKSEPGMSELMTAACTIALASRAIHGDFNAPAALELLYGSYDEQKKSAVWTDVSVPKNLPWAQNLNLSADGSMNVTTMATFDFTEGGQQKKLFVTNAVPPDGGCHACTGLLGLAVFVRNGSDWKVESTDPFVASMGAMGSVGDSFKWVPAGDDSFALIVKGHDMHQGYQTASTDIFVRKGSDKKFESVISDYDTGASDTESVEAETTFLKGKDPHHYDVKVVYSYSIPDQKTYVADHVYQFAKNKYVLVKKDDPPSFSRQSNSATASTDAAPTASQPVNTTAFSATCTSASACAVQMMTAARAENLPAAMAAAASLGALPKPVRGDRAAARKLNVAGLAALNANNASEAVGLLSSAVAADPSDEEVQSNLSYAYSVAGNYAQSINVAGVALTINPRRTSVWAPLAATFARMHDRQHALDAMWLAYQFSADKQKTLGFLNDRLKIETDPAVLQMYNESIAWFSENKRPEGL
jgi:Flp pilus assembly protein TadD